MVQDLDNLSNADPVIITGEDKAHGARVSPNKELGTTDILNTAGVYGPLTVTTTPVEIKVGVSKLTNRKSVTLDNTSNTTLFWGYDSSITSTNFAGRIFKDQQPVWAANISVFVVVASGSHIVQISEGS